MHRSSGRIYKIVYGEPKKAEPFDVAKMVREASTIGEVMAGVDASHNWWRRMAMRCFLEMKASEGKMAEVPADDFGYGVELLGPILNGDESSKAANILLFRPDFKNSWLPKHKANADAMSKLYTSLATSDESGLVRLYVASSMQRLPLDARWPIATALAKHEEDANDRQQPLMIWYGIEPAVAAEPMKGVELIREAKIPTVRRLVARRIAEMIEDKPQAVDALVALMTGSDAFQASRDGKMPSLLDDVLAGMTAGLDGFSSAKKPKGWDEFVVRALARSGEGDDEERAKARTTNIQTLSLVFGSGRAADELIAIVKNADGDANARLNAFKSLTRTTKPELLAVIRTLINDKVLGIAARSALAAYDDPSIPKQLTGSWPERSQEQQAATVATLTSRASYAKVLLEAVKAGKVPAAAISPFQARQIRNLGDEALTKLLTEAWGEIRETPEAKKAEFAKWEAVLKPETLAKADQSKGRMIFTAACGACHKMYGQGGAIGPELTGSDRRNLKYLLENILDPNAVVPADFRVSIFHLKDGRTLSGVVPEQTERTLTIQTPAERLTLERTQIVKQEQMAQSLMPEGLLAALGEENVLNLIAYLMGEGQVEMPK